MFCQHFRQNDFLSTNRSTVSFAAIAHQVTNENRTSIQEGIPVLRCYNIELPSDRHNGSLAFPLCSSIDPANAEQVEHLFRIFNHFWTVMDNTLRHFLSGLVITIFERLLVSSFRFKATFPSCCEFIRLQFWSRSVEDEHRLNAKRKHGCCSCQHTHQVCYNTSFRIT